MEPATERAAYQSEAAQFKDPALLVMQGLHSEEEPQEYLQSNLMHIIQIMVVFNGCCSQNDAKHFHLQ